MSKKNLNILIGILLFVLLGILIYFFFFFNKNQEAEIPTDPNGNGGLPVINFPGEDNENPLVDGDDPFDISFENDSIKQITKDAVGGFNFNTANNGEEEILFVDRINGHINKTSYDKSDEVEKISNTTIPKVYKSYFTNNNTKIIYQILDENNIDIIKTYFADINKPKELGDIEEGNLNATNTDELDETASADIEMEDIDNISEVRNGTLSGNFLLENISDIVKMSESKLFLMYNQKFDNDFQSLGAVFNTNTQNEYSKVSRFEFSEIGANKINADLVGITTKPKHDQIGYSWIFNTNTQKQDLILGPVLGLTTNYSPDGSKVLYSSSKNNRVKTYLYDMKTRILSTFPVNTMPEEKCVWNKTSDKIYCAIPLTIGSNNPDNWYKGAESFEDFLISYDLESQKMNFLYDNKYRLDLVDITLSPNEDFLLFQNKNDLSLWAFDLREIKNSTEEQEAAAE